MDDEEYQNALKALEAHNKAFEEKFAPKSDSNVVNHNDNDDSSDSNNYKDDDDDDEYDTNDEVEDLFNNNNKSNKNKIDDDNQQSNKPQPEVIVFGEPGTSHGNSKDLKREKKAFMSSQTSKVKNGPSDDKRRKRKIKKEEGNDIDDKSNIENDKELEMLLHSQLFTSRENTKNMKSGDKMRLLQGRLLELAGKADLGQGSSKLKQKEHNNAAGKIRVGLERRQDELKEHEITQAKELGIYDKSLKHIYGNDKNNKSNNKRSFGNLNADRDGKRQKGLGMGVGKFKNGMLTLSKNEIEKVNSQPRRRGK